MNIDEVPKSLNMDLHAAVFHVAAGAIGVPDIMEQVTSSCGLEGQEEVVRSLILEYAQYYDEQF